MPYFEKVPNGASWAEMCKVVVWEILCLAEGKNDEKPFLGLQGALL